MLSSPKQTTRLPVQRNEISGSAIPIVAPTLRMQKRRALGTAAIVPNATLSQSLHSSRHASPVSAINLYRESDLESNSSSDLHSDPDTKAYTDTKPDTSKDPDFSLDHKSDADLDSKAKEILKDIAQLKEEGPVKPNYTPYTTKL